MGPRTVRTQPAFGHQATGELRPADCGAERAQGDSDQQRATNRTGSESSKRKSETNNCSRCADEHARTAALHDSFSRERTVGEPPSAPGLAVPNPSIGLRAAAQDQPTVEKDQRPTRLQSDRDRVRPHGRSSPLARSAPQSAGWSSPVAWWPRAGWVRTVGPGGARRSLIRAIAQI